MGLEPTTPCLQICPTRTVANPDGRLRLVGLSIRTVENGGEWRRVVHEWSIAAIGSTIERVMKAPPNSTPLHESVPRRSLAARFDPLNAQLDGRGWDFGTHKLPTDNGHVRRANSEDRSRPRPGIGSHYRRVAVSAELVDGQEPRRSVCAHECIEREYRRTELDHHEMTRILPGVRSWNARGGCSGSLRCG